MTVKQVAARLEVSQATVYGLVAAGKLRCCRIGLGRGAIRISEEQLTDFLKVVQPEKPVVSSPVHTPRLKHLRIP